MASNIEIKRSAVPGKVPTTSSLQLGQIALNTYEGKAYLKKDNGVQSIIEIGSATFPYIGNAVITGSLTVSGSGITVIGNQTITGSLKVTGSYTLTGTTSLTGSVSISGSTTIIGTTNFSNSSTTITGSLLVSGSTTQIGNNTLTGNTSLSGSINISGSSTIRGTTSMTGSLLVSGSTTQIGNNTLTGNTLLSGSITISGSFPIGSYSSSVNIYGDTSMTGYLKFNPQSTNINTSISSSYIYVSGSTNDLYFSQNSNGFSNITRLRWLEGNLYTGLLNGGIITTQSSTVYQVQSGSGIIVTMNASLGSDPYPTVQYINWPTLSSSIASLSASYDQQFVAINTSAQIFAQGIPYYDGDYNTKIPLGIVIHQNHSTINAVQTFPSVGYGWKQRSYDFIKAFGPLKTSGYTLQASSSLGLLLGGGTAWVDGRNYTVDPNNPSYITEATGITTSKIYYYYQTGSDFKYDTNGGNGYTNVTASLYSNNGVLTALSTNNKWSIQRVYYFPNSATKAFYIYYGNVQYDTYAEALAGISTEAFTEAPNTAANAIFVGYMLLQKTANFTTTPGPTGTWEFRAGSLFRAGGSGGASGGGGGGATSLTGLTDVSITSPTNGQPLTYNATTTKWSNSSAITASVLGNLTGTAATASYVTASAVVGTVASSSYALTASYAMNGGGVTSIIAGSGISVNQSTGNVTITNTGGGGSTFPYIGNAVITGSLTVSGSGITGSLYGVAESALVKYELATYNFGGSNYKISDFQNSIMGVYSNFNPNISNAGDSIPTLLPYLYVDILDYTNQTAYYKQTFSTLSSLSSSLSSRGVVTGKLIFYSYQNDTKNMKVGGINILYSSIGNNKIQSRKSINPDTGSAAYTALNNFISSSLVTYGSSNIPNFTTNYINQNQVNTIHTGKVIGMVPINKYEKRHIKNFYYYNPKPNSSVNSSNSLVTPATTRSKLLAHILCSVVITKTTVPVFNFSFVALNTTYRYSWDNSGVFKANGNQGYFHIYIFETDPGLRSIAVEALTIDQLNLPFSSRSGDATGAHSSYMYLLKKNNTIAVSTSHTRTDTQLDIDGVSLIDNTFNINGNFFYNDKNNNDITAIRFYSNKTCDVFNRCCRLEYNKYNGTKLNYFKLNYNSP